jgi:Mn2+/Fe2+ NRAMP family transporter
MGNFLDVALGIVSAMGGFVDIGELIFLTQAGAKFYLSLVWVLVLGTAGVILYSEMAGRMAAVSGVTVFKAVQLKLGNRLGWVALGSSVLVTLVTCCAELGGMALIMQLGTTWPLWICASIAAVLVLGLIALLPFVIIENTLGFFGLAMLIFLVAVFFQNGYAVGDLLHKSREAVVMDGPRVLLYAYFAVGILTSSMMPYELTFYAAGAVEEKWTVKKLLANRLIAGFGFSFGLLVAFALMFNAAAKLAPLGIDPQLVGATALQAVIPFGWWGAVIALVGMFFAVTGAAVETAMSIGYSVCQFLDQPWGKEKSLREAPVFHAAWAATVLLGLCGMLIYQQPIQIAELAVVFSVLALPLAYLAVWMAASDRKLMGAHVNGRISGMGGLLFLGVLTVAAVIAIPLLIVTSGGQIW